ncbi:hypothetical protein BJ980_002245 [Nocardioides daedukensis]|uniref:Uncharacterized protein n=1 Tax=Nocardioides daedukensis TaxID=634462 RepID=A0A7Y9UQI9_9ACTN|nr:hypothetical protein [Nocardioides daedukensis]NYG59322.1 hypothetical protein [Nocardioides daedukensis]
MRRRHLHLASNRLFWQVGDPYVHPYSVDVSVEPLPAKVTVAEGVTHNAVAAILDIAEALSDTWAEHFARAEADWLRPYLLRVLDGDLVTEAELVDHFVRLHGRAPEVTDSQHI